jgi:hypothetical protein
MQRQKRKEGMLLVSTFCIVLCVSVGVLYGQFQHSSALSNSMQKNEIAAPSALIGTGVDPSMGQDGWSPAVSDHH